MEARRRTAASRRDTTTTLSWRSLLAGIAATAAAGYFLYSATIHEFPPAGFVYGTLLLLAAWRVWRSGSTLAIGAAGVLHAFEVITALFVYGNPQMITNPGAWQDFLVGVFFLVANITGTIAAVGAWRARPAR